MAGKSKLNGGIAFSAVRTDRGRINIDITDDSGGPGTQEHHWQDDSFGGFSACAYVFVGGDDATCKIEIKVWTTP